MQIVLSECLRIPFLISSFLSFFAKQKILKFRNLTGKKVKENLKIIYILNSNILLKEEKLLSKYFIGFQRGKKLYVGSRGI